jgi:putative transcriptional regulator
MKKLVSTLPELRARNGRLSIAEVARRIDVAASTLSKLETGKTKGIDFETVVKLCAFFDVGPGDLFRLVDADDSKQSFNYLASVPAA